MAVNLAGSLGVSVGYLLDVEDERDVDEETLRRLHALQQLDPKTRRTVLEVLDTFIRDASARQAYA